jgi:hypothetical protein
VFDGFGSLGDGTADHGGDQNGSFPQSLAGVGQYATGRVAYLVTIAHANLARMYRAAERGPVRISISCEHFVSDAAQGIIDTLAVKAAQGATSKLLLDWATRLSGWREQPPLLPWRGPTHRMNRTEKMAPNGAIYEGKQGSIGSVEVGNTADLVVN